MKLKRATIKDIAKESGYSVMTVSFALRNHEKVKETTKQKILEVANRLGYRPDPEMVRLMHRVRRNPELERTENFALVNLFADAEDINRDYFTIKVMEGLKRRLEKHGYNLLNYWVDEKDSNNEKISKDLKNKGVNGLVIPVLPQKRVSKLNLDWEKFTVVSIDERPILPNFHRVHPHHYNNVIILLNRLVEMGFKRIGFVSVLHMLGLDKYALFAAHYAYANFLNRDVVWVPPLENCDDKEKLKAWYRKHKPDCVIMTANWLEGYFRAALDIRIPEDLSMVSISSEGDVVAGIDQKPELIGSATADLIMAHVNRYERGIPPFAKTVMIDGEWKDGRTLKPKKRN